MIHLDSHWFVVRTPRGAVWPPEMHLPRCMFQSLKKNTHPSSKENNSTTITPRPNNPSIPKDPALLSKASILGIITDRTKAAQSIQGALGLGHAGHATHQEHLIDLLRLHSSILQANVGDVQRPREVGCRWPERSDFTCCFHERPGQRNSFTEVVQRNQRKPPPPVFFQTF